MRLHLHQCQLDFAISFFGGKSSFQSPIYSQDSGESQMLPKKSTVLGGHNITEEALLPYFQASRHFARLFSKWHIFTHLHNQMHINVKKFMRYWSIIVVGLTQLYVCSIWSSIKIWDVYFPDNLCFSLECETLTCSTFMCWYYWFFFFQKFDIWPVLVRVDYSPSRVDLAALRGGKYVELVNLVPWKVTNLIWLDTYKVQC